MNYQRIQKLTEDLDQNYRQFFLEATSQGCVWGLQSEVGWAQSTSDKYPDTPVMPFWSQPEYAQCHCQEEWQAYQVIPIALEEFLEEWLPGMHEDVVLVGVNWNQDLEGQDIEPLDLLVEFEQITE